MYSEEQEGEFSHYLELAKIECLRKWVWGGGFERIEKRSVIRVSKVKTVTLKVNTKVN